MIRTILPWFVTFAVIAISPAGLSHQPHKPRRIEIIVTESGFDPRKVTVLKNEEVTLVFTRKTDETCAKEVIVYLDRTDIKRKVERKLPLSKPVELTLRFDSYGEHGFACAMGHKAGMIQVN